MADMFIQRLEQADRGDSLEPRKPTQAEADQQAANRNWRAYVRARDNGHLDWLKIAKKCDQYYTGDQWEKDVTDDLDGQQRPHSTINMVLSTVNSILGEHIRQRQEILFSPRGKGATEDVAAALSFVAKQIQYNNKSHWCEQQVVADGLVEDRGYYDMRIDFSDNVQGEVREIALDPRDVLLDAGAKEYDPNTWKEVIRTRWLTPDEIAVFYGRKKADQLTERAVSARFSSDSVEFETGHRPYGAQEGSEFADDTLDPDEVRRVRRIRIIERQWKKFARGVYFVDPEEGDLRRVPDNWDEERSIGHAAKFGLDMIERPELRIRWTVSADDILLYDEWSLYNRFTVIPFFPYFRRGKPTGLVRHLLSPQDMLNKITSQELHVVNTTANSGWIFESGSLINMDTDDLEKVGARTGLILEYKKGSTPPIKIQPNQVPSGLDHIATKAQIFFRNVSGLPETFVSGQSSREISGVAFDKQNQAGSGSLDVVWDNLAKTRQYRAEFMLELIQQWYTETRLIQVTELDEDGHEVSRDMEVNVGEVDQETAEEQILNNLALGEYSVIVTSQPHYAAVQDEEFAQLLEMRNAGIAIPDWAIVEVSRHRNKKEIAEVIKKIQGMSDPTPEEIQMQLEAQKLALMGQQAQVRGLIADAMNKEAQAQLALAKAKGEEQKPFVEMQKMGVELRAKLEAMNTELEKSIREIEARLAISREKNETIRFEAQMESMTRRLGTLTKRETDLLGLAQKAREARTRSRSPTSVN